MTPHTCPKCDGERTVALNAFSKRQCPTCAGTGVVWEPAVTFVPFTPFIPYVPIVPFIPYTPGPGPTVNPLPWQTIEITCDSDVATTASA